MVARIFQLCSALFVIVAGMCDLLSQEASWREDFKDISRWTAMPTWLGNPAATVSLTTDGKGATFRVKEPNKGMKWRRPLPQVFLEEAPYLCVRYRAQNLNTERSDYFIYLDDHSSVQFDAIRLSEIAADGKWHTVAVNACRDARGDVIAAMAIQVQANEDGNARLDVESVAFLEHIPEGAEELRPVPLVQLPDCVVAIGETGDEWIAHNDWLSNPASRHEVSHDGKCATFRVLDQGRGMKWSRDLPSELSIEGRRYVSMRYCARNIAPSGDYILCVLGGAGHGGYDTAVRLSEILADGRWHTITQDVVGLVGEIPVIKGVAVQVQTGHEPVPAELAIADIRFTTEMPDTVLSDFVEWEGGANFDNLAPVSLGPFTNADMSPILKRLRIKDWPGAESVTVCEIPFELADSGLRALISGVRETGELMVPLKHESNEIFLLVVAALLGHEEPARALRRDGERFKRIADVDRFRVKMNYSDGSVDECLPVNVGSRRFEVVNGPQVLCVLADGSKKLQSISLCDGTKRAAFALAGVTYRVSGGRRFASFAEDMPPLTLKVKQVAVEEKPSEIALQDNRLTFSNSFLECTMEPAPVPRVLTLNNRLKGDSCLKGGEPSSFFTIRLNGSELNPDEIRLIQPPKITRQKGRSTAELEYDLARKLRLHLDLSLSGEPALRVSARVENTSQEPTKLGFSLPSVGGVRLGNSLEENYYLFPKCGSVFSNEGWSYRARFCGGFPVQFVSIFNPNADSGLHLRTEDQEGVWRYYILGKDDRQLHISIEYPELELKPNDVRHMAPTVLALSGGDWHEGFEAYRRWVASWYPRPDPAKQWFREVFNFRQRFLWTFDGLYDATTGEFHLERAIDEAKTEFGGIDYLHIFDWGNCPGYGRLYGRTGDHSPYQYFKGGREAFRKAIEGVQARGVPVGLYIEGYLLQERGRLGQEYGKLWQLIGSDGKGRWWKDSTEMYVCSFVPDWREVQASTYAAKVRELDVDGMYVDQYGFARDGRDCYSPRHGHRVPGYTVLGEMGCMKLIRKRVDGVKKGVALYSEETPCDVASRYQDGSFSYAMRHLRYAKSAVPINIFRFAIPQFKTIQILVCDRPTGTWATGVKWIFFNGEAIWLEGVAREWFSQETRATIRKCYAILHEHRDAFTTLHPVPLVPTEMGGVFANEFPAEGKTVYTLYNSRHRTVRGIMLRLPRVRGVRYFDAWNGRAVSPRSENGFDLIPTEIGPRGVGCIVCDRRGEPP